MTSIAQWHMDQAVFGNPTWSLSNQPNPTFKKGIGEVGSGQYEILHWARPHMIQASWQMNGTDFNAFVLAWNDVAQLAFGANWFTVDMPLQIDGGGVADRSTQIQVSKMLGVDVATSGTSHGYTVDYGGMKSVNVLGRHVSGISIDTATDTATLSTFEGTPFPAPNTNTVIIRPRVPGEEGVELVMNHQGGGVYTATGVSATSGWGAYWAAQTGETVMAELVATVDVWQRYVAHWNGPYQASRIGFDYWNVTGQLEVNVHEVDIWKAAS